MRSTVLVFIAASAAGGTGCGSSKDHGGSLPDAPPASDAAIDAMIDAGPPPTVLLAGGTDITTQGWQIVRQAPAVLTSGADYTQLDTTSQTTGSTSGQLLLYKTGAVPIGQPFKLQVVMLVEAVHPHNQYDAAAAILGSFTPSIGTQTERGEMIYLDANAVGWADDSKPPLAVTVTDGAYHTYELFVDAAATAHLTVDGGTELTRDNYTTNGTLAIGDQTNDVMNGNVDSILRVRSVSMLHVD